MRLGSAGISVRPYHELNPWFLADIIVQLTQSQENFHIDDELVIEVDRLRVQVGRGYNFRGEPIDKLLRHCIVTIKNTDHLCLARALVVAKARFDRGNIRIGALHEDYRSLSRKDSAQSKQTQAAKNLIRDAKVKMPREGSGVREIIGFQKYFENEGLAITVYEEGKIGDGGPIFYDGRQYLTEKNISVKGVLSILYDPLLKHFDVITSLTAALSERNYCIPCNKGFKRIIDHKCPEKCPQCFR